MRVDAKLLLPALVALIGAAVPTVPLAQSTSSSVIVEERRVTSDAMIQALVMERLAANPRLEGRIGVESRDAVVTLTGWTRNESQAWLAELETRRVAGVAYVHNQIRPRMSA
jgi:osmotically-inducible protein OsmY